MQQTDVIDARERQLALDRPHWAMRLAQWVITRWRPDAGWLVFFVCIALAALPPGALGENRLAELRTIQVWLDLAGPLAVVATWLWLGWRRPPAPVRQRPWRALGAAAGILLTGVLVLSDMLVGWVPSLAEVIQAIRTNGWATLFQQVLNDWGVMFTRFGLWWQGVRAGGAAQDNLIFAAVAGATFWLAGSTSAWLARRTRQGFLGAAPVLWLMGTMLLYTPGGRGLMLTGVLLTLALHLLLDQEALMRGWVAAGLDFSPSLYFDRLVASASVVALFVFLAVITPNWYMESLVWGYYGLVEPAERRLNDVRDRLFPNLRGTSRLRGGGTLEGMPNEFLLGAGSNLGDKVVMYVRTNDSIGYEDLYGGAPFDLPPPPGHYMRGVTLTSYDGRGWSNPPSTTRIDYAANQPWSATEVAGRKQLVQSITVLVNTSVLYGAPEQVEPGINYDAEVRADGDLIALWSRARNYTIVSSIPAVSETDLAAALNWGPDLPLPAGYDIHLDLPDVITERTRQLAHDLTDGEPTPYARAKAIETYLRQYEYDLEVDEPPRSVEEVADYFLFDLQRGYCDYYTTAFIVLARLAGLPARFATGFAVGSWDPLDGVWIVTEAEAHSWPEVFFPEYGWIAFEPTAGRPELARIGLPETRSVAAVPLPPPTLAPPPAPTAWNWQMIFWLLPLGIVTWGALRMIDAWQRQREDPWQGLLRWGQRSGRPLGDGETVLEYGRGLAGYIVERQKEAADTGRVAAREVTALSNAVNHLHYAPDPQRDSAGALAIEHWQRLRGYLPRLRIRR
jgi:transglutaminase-like putative cysteine protease